MRGNKKLVFLLFAVLFMFILFFASVSAQNAVGTSFQNLKNAILGATNNSIVLTFKSLSLSVYNDLLSNAQGGFTKYVGMFDKVGEIIGILLSFPLYEWISGILLNVRNINYFDQFYLLAIPAKFLGIFVFFVLAVTFVYFFARMAYLFSSFNSVITFILPIILIITASHIGVITIFTKAFLALISGLIYGFMHVASWAVAALVVKVSYWGYALVGVMALISLIGLIFSIRWAIISAAKGEPRLQFDAEIISVILLLIISFSTLFFLVQFGLISSGMPVTLTPNLPTGTGIQFTSPVTPTTPTTLPANPTITPSSSTIPIGGTTNFVVNGNTHTITLNGVEDGKAKITVKSEPKDYELILNQPKEIDTDGDFVPDTIVEIKEVNGEYVITTKSLDEIGSSISAYKILVTLLIIALFLTIFFVVWMIFENIRARGRIDRVMQYENRAYRAGSAAKVLGDIGEGFSLQGSERNVNEGIIVRRALGISNSRFFKAKGVIGFILGALTAFFIGLGAGWEQYWITPVGGVIGVLIELGVRNKDKVTHGAEVFTHGTLKGFSQYSIFIRIVAEIGIIVFLYWYIPDLWIILVCVLTFIPFEMIFYNLAKNKSQAVSSANNP